MKKRIFTLALVLIMCLSLIPTIALASEDIVYTDTRDNQITISGGAASCAALIGKQLLRKANILNLTAKGGTEPLNPY